MSLKRNLRLLGQKLSPPAAQPARPVVAPALAPRRGKSGRAGQPMMRVPPGFHPQAVRNGNQLANMPGRGGSGMQPMQRVPIGAYTGKLTGVTLSGGQVQGTIPAGGALTLTVGPQGIGTVWYPASATVSTTTGPLDTSTCKVYLGYAGAGTPTQLLATVFTGNGTVAIAVPPMVPGQVLIFTWTGGHTGDTAGANVIGTQDALTTGA